MSDVTVLMYHAVLGDPRTAKGEDSHYAVSTHNFKSQIETLLRGGFAVRSVRDLLDDRVRNAVAVTFDDIHESTRAGTFPVLASNGLSADFFVVTSAVETESNISWAGLREMGDAGMSIQSGGRTRSYLDDLTEREVVDELATSKKEIEDRIGRAVEIFSPPHGRFNGRVVRAARRAGYRVMCCSRPGRWKTSPPGPGGAGGELFEIPRLAVLGSTSAERLQGWARGDGVNKMMLRYRALLMAKAVLGNNAYEKLRTRLLGSGGGA